MLKNDICIQLFLFIINIIYPFFLFRELSTMFARLCRLVDEATTEMDSELCDVKEATKMLDEASSSAKKLRNKAHYLAHELELFDEAFLKHN